MKNGRISLTWRNIPKIFMASLRELDFMEMCISGFVAGGLAYGSCCYSKARVLGGPLAPYAALAFWFHVAMWGGFVLFRYYFLPSHWTLTQKFIAGALYGTSLMLFILLFYTLTLGEMLHIIICAGGSAIALMTPWDKRWR